MANLNIATNLEPWLVVGYVQIAELDDEDCPICFYNAGKTENLQITPANETLECEDELGNTFQSCTISTSLDMTFDMKSYDRRNLARALFGSQSVIPAQAGIVKEAYACPGSIVPLKSIDCTVVSVVDVDTGAPLVEGTDYTVSCGSISILTGAAPTDPTDITTTPKWAVTYDCEEQTCIEGYNQESKNFALNFEGIDKCSGSAVTVDIHKISLEPASFNLLTDNDFGRLSFNSKILATTCPEITQDANASPFYRQCYHSLGDSATEG